MGSQREIVLVYLITLSSLVFFVAVINGNGPHGKFENEFLAAQLFIL
jgi:hypothetical protein